LRLVGNLHESVGTPSGGDISPDGSLIAIRSYTKAMVWRRTGGSIAATLDNRPPDTVVDLLPSPQGEAICWAADSGSRQGIYVTSEGVRQPISFCELLT